MAYLALLTGILLFPFNFSFSAPANGARWLPDGGGIAFSPSGVLRSSGPPDRLYKDLVNASGLSLEIRVSPAALATPGLVRIVSYSGGYGPHRNFTLGQDGRDLVVRLRTDDEDWSRVAPVSNVFGQADTWVHVVVTYDRSEIRVYRDGEALASRPLSGRFDPWDPAYILLVGNEATYDEPWAGRISRLGIYDRPLSPEEARSAYARALAGPGGVRPEGGPVAFYNFSGSDGRSVPDLGGRSPPIDLIAPAALSRPLWESFVSADSLAFDPLEVAANVLIFVPLGFLLCGLLAVRMAWPAAATAALVLGLSFSLGLESVQHGLPGRFPSLLDLAANGTGLAVGLLGWISWQGRRAS